MLVNNRHCYLEVLGSSSSNSWQQVVAFTFNFWYTKSRQVNHMNPFGIVQLTRTKHDGTVEVLVQFKNEKPAWIPLSTLLAIRENSSETVH